MGVAENPIFFGTPSVIAAAVAVLTYTHRQNIESVVTRQAPVSLKWKNYLREEKKVRTYVRTYVSTEQYTSLLKHIVHLKQDT